MIEAIGQPFELDGHQVVDRRERRHRGGARRRQRARRAVEERRPGALSREGRGRGTYRFFEPEMDARMQARRELELDLRRALAAGEFELLLPAARQSRRPTRSPASRRCCAGTIPSAGMVPPARVHSAWPEEIGLIVPIGEWVLREACSAGRDLAGAASRSRSTCRRCSSAPAPRASVVMRAGRDPASPPTVWSWRSPRSVLLQDSEATLATLQRAARARRAHRDGRFRHRLFLAQLSAQLPVRQDQDRPLLRQRSRRSATTALAIVRAVVGLGHEPRHRDHRGGRRDPGAARMLRDEGCTEVQGYLLSAAAARRRDCQPDPRSQEEMRQHRCLIRRLSRAWGRRGCRPCAA